VNFVKKRFSMENNIDRLITFLHGAIAVLFLVIMYMLFPAVDIAIEMNEISTESDHQRNRIAFLEVVANESVKNCNISVTDFEYFARNHYNTNVIWRNDKYWLHGGVEVTKNASCIKEVRFRS
jgi:hypothetical protein